MPLLTSLFFDLFAVRQCTYKDADLDDIQNCEQAISRAFMTLSENLYEEDLKPVFSKLSNWVKEALKPNSKLEVRHRVLTIYSFANKLFNYCIHFESDEFESVVLNFVCQLFAYTPGILKRLNVAKIDPDELFIDGTSDENSNDQVVDQLITSVIDFITNCAEYKPFRGEDWIKLVYETVLDEIENREVVRHEKRCLDHLVDCIYHLSVSAPKSFVSSLGEKLLHKLENPYSFVRLQATVIFEKLVVEFGEVLAPLLPTVVQYLSEIDEDSDATIRQLKHVFGDDVMEKIELFTHYCCY